MKTRYILVLIIVLSSLVSAETEAKKTEAKPPLHLAVYVADEAGWRVTSTLIYGATESILVDTQYLKTHAAKLADQIATDATLATVVIALGCDVSAHDNDRKPDRLARFAPKSRSVWTPNTLFNSTSAVSS